MVVSQFVEKLVRSWCFCIHFSAQKCTLVFYAFCMSYVWLTIPMGRKPGQVMVGSQCVGKPVMAWLDLNEQARKAGQVMAGARGE